MANQTVKTEKKKTNIFYEIKILASIFEKANQTIK